MQLPRSFRASWIPVDRGELNHSLCLSRLLSTHSVLLFCVHYFIYNIRPEEEEQPAERKAL